MISGHSLRAKSARPPRPLHPPPPQSAPGLLVAMRASNSALLVALFTTLLLMVESCEPEHSQHGCKIYGGSCSCGYGCKTEYFYRTRSTCLNAVRERSSNVCFRMPCMTGNCIQTVQDPGFSCKCEGTGFYGQRCEKACPTIPMRGLVFPHECIVI